MKKQGFFFSLLASMLMLYACDESPSEEKVDPVFSFLVGTYTESGYQGIQMLSFDPQKMALSSKIIAPTQNPSFVIANKAQNLVFSVEETAGENGGKVKSFKFDRMEGTLELISVLDTFGDHPCYLSLDPSEGFLVVGNYSGGNLSVYKVNEGELVHVQTIQHEGQSINASRQEKAHVHSTVFHTDGKKLLVGDLGSDKIHIYDFHPDYSVPLVPSNPAYIEVTPGSGPRHLVIHPKGDQFYLVHELSAELGVYTYAAGKISQTQTLPLTNPNYSGSVGAAEVRISADGKFVYASNRGDANEISVFEIGNDKKLSLVQRISSGGQMPRNFNLSPDGEFLLVAHQASNDIVVFERNTKTGELSKTDLRFSIPKPVYLYALP
ncbi:hypothetical protein P872_09860 [Rhodonellum psychrophilum GCM71 = DSM 17998]|uniref:3-carboxymuconate cyclase n=2 Tax=Rhodonellum TaxID=336827 RepID=U5BXU8_9BACT|nr:MULTISPECIES: lactonase family protein [Rhodonellum]ERM81446.1 hypothetical protein P872_09860 [Rhodonellum psychrophilum GCM71 = DSM 17998]SDZ27381.1 6-phosphogluconolactonase, cycloisomerase 2 family [Rhodonellum ikkaensis]